MFEIVCPKCKSNLHSKVGGVQYGEATWGHSTLKSRRLQLPNYVSKDTLDIYRPNTGERVKIGNTEVEINGLCKVWKKKQVLVAMEATGGYETLLVRCLAMHGIDAAVLNPRQLRDFAKGIGLDAKTDPIDAQLISQFASFVKPKAMPMASDHEQKHTVLVTRRCQLLELINQENNRLKQSWDDVGGKRTLAR